MSEANNADDVRRVVFGALAAAGLKWQAQHATNFVMAALEDAGFVARPPRWPGPFPPDGMNPKAYEPPVRNDGAGVSK